MTSRELTQQNPPKGWWSPLLWSIASLILGSLLLGPILILLLQTFLDSETAVYFASLYSFIAILLLIFAVNKFINKRSIQALGFHHEGLLKKYLYGVLSAAVLLFIIIGSLSFLGFYTFSVSDNTSMGLILAALIGFMIQGMTEEVVCRGYLQNGFFAATSSMWVAIFGQALVFSLLHGLNPGMTFFALLNLFVVAVAFGVIFWLTDSIWLVSGLHFLWNFALGPLLGIKISGRRTPFSLLVGSANGSGIMTGGVFGVEASIITTIVFTLACIAVVRKIKSQAE